MLNFSRKKQMVLAIFFFFAFAAFIVIIPLEFADAQPIVSRNQGAKDQSGGRGVLHRDVKSGGLVSSSVNSQSSGNRRSREQDSGSYGLDGFSDFVPSLENLEIPSSSLDFNFPNFPDLDSISQDLVDQLLGSLGDVFSNLFQFFLNPDISQLIGEIPLLEEGKSNLENIFQGREVDSIMEAFEEAALPVKTLAVDKDFSKGKTFSRMIGLPSTDNGSGELPGGSLAKSWIEDSMNRSGIVGPKAQRKFLHRMETERWKKEEWEPFWRNQSSLVLSSKIFPSCLSPRIIRHGPMPECSPGFFFPNRELCEANVPVFQRGTEIEFWWPTYAIEISKYGISMIPAEQATRDLSKAELLKQLQTELTESRKKSLEQMFGTDASNSGISFDEIFGISQSGSSGGLRGRSLSGGRLGYGEAHIFVTALQDNAAKKRTLGGGRKGKVFYKFFLYGCKGFDFWFNGYLFGNPGCFFDALEPDGDRIKAWTEEIPFALFWSDPYRSKEINPAFAAAVQPPLSSGRALHASLASEGLSSEPWAHYETCSSFYAALFSKSSAPPLSGRTGEVGPSNFDGFKDVSNTGELGFKINPLKGAQPWNSSAPLPDKYRALNAVCYPGGRSLYPLSGYIPPSGPHISIYLARRAAELVGQLDRLDAQESSGNAWSVHNAHEYKSWRKSSGLRGGHFDHVNLYTRWIWDKAREQPFKKEIDRLQIVLPMETFEKGKPPSPSRCFTISEFDERDESIFRKAKQGSEHGDINVFFLWEKRRALECPFRGIVSALENDNGWDNVTHRFVKKLMKKYSAGYSINKGWGCQIWPSNNPDEGRGNVEESEIISEAIVAFGDPKVGTMRNCTMSPFSRSSGASGFCSAECALPSFDDPPDIPIKNPCHNMWSSIISGDSTTTTTRPSTTISSKSSLGERGVLSGGIGLR